METSSILQKIVEPLLNWYQENARILPWRIDPDPYRILVSEIMLQQTRVETVKPYFERFLSVLPTIEALAQADEKLLLKLWEGMGYYQRVRNLQKSAQIIIQEYSGLVPHDYQTLLKLPGIGEYTAGSVASIAYNVPVPAVDGNVLRVTARLLNSRDNISLPAVRKHFRQIIADILPESSPGKFNQAIMELGATVCLPRNTPLCTECPITEYCLACKNQCAGELPIKEPMKTRKTEQRTLLIILSKKGVLLKQRTEKGLLSGLWEYPNLETFLTPEQIRKQFSDWFFSLPEKVMQIPPAKHIFTHLEWHMHAYLIYTENLSSPDAYQWIPLEEVDQNYAIPSAFQFYTVRLKSWSQQFHITDQSKGRFEN